MYRGQLSDELLVQFVLSDVHDNGSAVRADGGQLGLLQLFEQLLFFGHEEFMRLDGAFAGDGGQQAASSLLQRALCRVVQKASTRKTAMSLG